MLLQLWQQGRFVQNDYVNTFSKALTNYHFLRLQCVALIMFSVIFPTLPAECTANPFYMRSVSAGNGCFTRPEINL
ncbi:hypothetical protein D3C71_1696200 [compost metagenome]